MNWQFRPAAALLLGLAMALTLGCESAVSKVKVTGKLLMNGQPLNVSKKTQVVLKFAPDEEKPLQTYPAKYFHETGQYEVELPAGKYSVRCHIVDESMKKVPTATVKTYELSKAQILDIDVTPE